MIHDLKNILEGWEYEPGKISVRKIIGKDGREKIQTRVDMGVLQCEISGRPDGLKPYGCESLLEYFPEALRKNSSDEGKASLSADACRELRHEAHLFYQRYLALYVLGEFTEVIRDTAHHLDVMDLCLQYAEEECDRDAMEHQRVYVFMMNVRSRTYLAIENEQYADAYRQVNNGICRLREIIECEHEFDESEAPEIRILSALRNEVLEKTPVNHSCRIRRELSQALECEDYERAAEIRDILSRGK